MEMAFPSIFGKAAANKLITALTNKPNGAQKMEAAASAMQAGATAIEALKSVFGEEAFLKAMNAATGKGRSIVRFSEPNAYGVLDHWVEIAGKAEMYIPLRMLANGSCTEVELVLFRQPEMNDVDFDRDEGLVRQDLTGLKKLLEKSR